MRSSIKKFLSARATIEYIIAAVLVALAVIIGAHIP